MTSVGEDILKNKKWLHGYDKNFCVSISYTYKKRFSNVQKKRHFDDERIFVYKTSIFKFVDANFI